MATTHLLPERHFPTSRDTANKSSRAGGMIVTADSIVESDSHRRIGAADKQINLFLEPRIAM